MCSSLYTMLYIFCNLLSYSVYCTVHMVLNAVPSCIACCIAYIAQHPGPYSQCQKYTNTFIGLSRTPLSVGSAGSIQILVCAYRCLFNSFSWTILLENQHSLSQWLQALVCVIWQGECHLSEYKDTAEVIPASTSLVLMQRSVSFLFVETAGLAKKKLSMNILI